MHYSRLRRRGDVETVLPPGVPASEAPCSAHGCDRRAIARGLCSKHWQKLQVYGDPLGGTDRGETPQARFWRKVDKNGPTPAHAPYLGPCWVWTAAKIKSGYGVFRLNGRQQKAHRVAYAWANGAIPDDLVMDHLCRNRACCRPTHLEPVTDQVNVLRGISPFGINAAKTHCVHGHEFTPENTGTQPAKNGRTARLCRECSRIRCRAYYHRRKKQD